MLKHGHLEQAAQDHIHTTFKYLQGGMCHHLCGQPVPFFWWKNIYHSEKVHPDVLMFYVSACVIASC